jgi:AcrR family transcriptional regulator
MSSSPESRTARARRREAMLDGADARAIRTRQRLSAALTQSMTEGSPTPPPVSRVCELAGVTRSAFYSHFSGLDELAVFAVSEVFEQLGEDDLRRRAGAPLTPREAATIVIRDLVARFDTAPTLFTWAVAGAGARTAWMVIDLVASRTRRTVAALGVAPASVDLAVVADFLAGGVVNAVRAHVAQGHGEMPAAERGEHLVSEIVALLPAWLTAES